MQNSFDEQSAEAITSPLIDPSTQRIVEEREFLKSVTLDQFSDREKAFLDVLVGHSQVKSALNQLQTFTNLQQKIDFCLDNISNLDREDRLKWELLQKGYNIRPNWEMYMGIATGIVTKNSSFQKLNLSKNTNFLRAYSPIF